MVGNALCAVVYFKANELLLEPDEVFNFIFYFGNCVSGDEVIEVIEKVDCTCGISPNQAASKKRANLLTK